MMKLGSSKMTLPVLMAAALIVAAGGAAIASNMGFKINKQILPIAQIANAIGNNWTALPYNIPYATAADLCTQGGLQAGAGGAVVTFTNPATNVSVNFTCGGVGAFTMPTNGVGVLIKEKGTCSGAPAVTCTLCCDTSLAAPYNCNSPTTAACPAGAADTCAAGTGPCVARSHIFVGSHNPTQSVSVQRNCTGVNNPAGCPGPQGEFWFSVPYHTTAVTFQDICVQAGLPSGVTGAQLTRRRSSDGAAINAFCGTAAASTQNLVLGEAVRIHTPTNPGPVVFIPAHF